MKESTTYQYVLEEGAAIGATKGAKKFRNLLIKFAQKRLGSPSSMITSALEAVDDLDRLERMGDRVDEVSNWQELLDTP